MPSNIYRFVSRWRVEGEISEAADVIFDPLSLVGWWPSLFVDVRELDPGDESGIGRTLDILSRGWLPYTVRFTLGVVETEYPCRSVLVSEGELEGQGTWTLAQNGPWVDITYQWDVRADKPLLRYLSLIFRPIFAANHGWAMKKGEQSLRLELARRGALTPEERAAIPPPPPAATVSAARLALGSLAVLTASAWLGFRLVRRLRGS